MFNTTRMNEAGVAIRLAERFLMFPGAAARAKIAIDSAVIEIAGRGQFFDIAAFLSANRWKLVRQEGQRSWHSVYARREQQLHINSVSGTADVLLELGNRRVVAECKGGPAREETRKAARYCRRISRSSLAGAGPRSLNRHFCLYILRYFNAAQCLVLPLGASP
jgi:hypothetical protein